ncbi:pilus assembly protein PilW [Pseudomonas capeferrum]|uniref:PilW family protein n=1 Tax=Pseudomonas capeferrum TaxID=1495066 RepID=UPI0015E2A125|nr:pilus assembly protein PilW [Pseudomonas capeferrum]MBA1202589.1 pilus assembly protein PilW [Pseudomonas capeferrum]
MEAVLALGLGLLVLTGATQVFVAGHQAWRIQGVTAALQDDARLVLQRMAQELRMTGMFGCLKRSVIEFEDKRAVPAIARPFLLRQAADGRLDTLDLVGAELEQAGVRPDWTLITDCRTKASVHEGARAAGAGEIAIPLLRRSYRLSGDRLILKSGGITAALVSHVRDLRITRVPQGEYERLDLELTLFEPTHGIEQRYAYSVTLRNRLSSS